MMLAHVLVDMSLRPSLKAPENKLGLSKWKSLIFQLHLKPLECSININVLLVDAHILAPLPICLIFLTVKVIWSKYFRLIWRSSWKSKIDESKTNYKLRLGCWHYTYLNVYTTQLFPLILLYLTVELSWIMKPSPHLWTLHNT